MAATLFRAPIAPLPTAVSTAFIPQGPFQRYGRRFENGTLTTTARGPDCSKFNGFQTCSSGGDYGRCLASTEAAFCNCNNGVQYLDCVSAAIASSTCVGAVGVDDWDAYERSWFQTSCPTPPSSVMSQLPQPTSVNLDLQSVITIIPSGPISQPPRPTATPNFQDGGELLAGGCQSTSYTLISDKDVVLYAAVVGCNSDRPQCCPWNVSSDATPSNPGSGSPQGNQVAAQPGQFPVPAANVKDSLDRCPHDYYSVSGQCCPNGYYKFTRQIAYQTPCFSSLAGSATPPPITLGLAANPTHSSLPTSAIVNLAWAMAFNVSSEPAPVLSKGAVVGVGVGASVAAIAIVAAVVFMVIRWRRKRRAGGLAAVAAADRDTHVSVVGETQQGMTYREGYHAPGEGQMSPREVKPGFGVAGGGGEWERGYGYGGAPQGYHQAAGYQGQHQAGEYQGQHHGGGYDGYYRS